MQRTGKFEKYQKEALDGHISMLPHIVEYEEVFQSQKYYSFKEYPHNIYIDGIEDL